MFRLLSFTQEASIGFLAVHSRQLFSETCVIQWQKETGGIQLQCQEKMTDCKLNSTKVSWCMNALNFDALVSSNTFNVEKFCALEICEKTDRSSLSCLVGFIEGGIFSTALPIFTFLFCCLWCDAVCVFGLPQLSCDQSGLREGKQHLQLHCMEVLQSCHIACNFVTWQVFAAITLLVSDGSRVLHGDNLQAATMTTNATLQQTACPF